ncbi:hypothetical protein [Streptomyces sp. NPDC017993]|uniref:hypothetical protein n=1 Tax=Streptomyces sp. NPDC017993 TaxID=3365027 RepID=UPI0037BD2FE4
MSEATDPYEHTPTTLVYDIFAERSGQLIAQYTRLSDTAADGVERERWWQKALEVRDAKRAVPAHDREQLLAHISSWAADIEALKEGE